MTKSRQVTLRRCDYAAKSPDDTGHTETPESLLRQVTLRPLVPRRTIISSKVCEIKRKTKCLASQCYLCTVCTSHSEIARPFPVFPLNFQNFCSLFPMFSNKMVLGSQGNIPGKVPGFVLPVPVDLWSQW